MVLPLSWAVLVLAADLIPGARGTRLRSSDISGVFCSEKLIEATKVRPAACRATKNARFSATAGNSRIVRLEMQLLHPNITHFSFLLA